MRVIEGILIGTIVIVLIGGVLMVASMTYEIFGEEPQKRAATEAARRERCPTMGGTWIATQVSHTKGGAYYSGWVCAKIEVLTP